MSKRLVYGHGINDADYAVNPMMNGKRYNDCPYYTKWMSMLTRCYSDKLHQKNPTYRDATVCEEWLTFSVFKQWMEKQDWQGKELDKDIITPGNKHYAPEHCVFVSRALNQLLTTRDASRGKYPQGVDWHKRDKKFRASIRIEGESKHIGYYDSVAEAEEAYLDAKMNTLLWYSKLQTDERIADGLVQHCAYYFDDYLHIAA